MAGEIPIETTSSGFTALMSFAVDICISNFSSIVFSRAYALGYIRG